MATDVRTESKGVPIFEYQGRPCVVAGEATVQRRPIRGKRLGSYQAVRVRFIDGKPGADPSALVGKRTWGKASKVLKGSHVRYWRRVDELQNSGMEAARAAQQAMAELTKGVI